MRAKTEGKEGKAAAGMHAWTTAFGREALAPGGCMWVPGRQPRDSPPKLLPLGYSGSRIRKEGAGRPGAERGDSDNRGFPGALAA